MSYIFNMLGLESSGFILSLGITLVLTGLVVFYFKQQEKNTSNKIENLITMVRTLAEQTDNNTSAINKIHNNLNFQYENNLMQNTNMEYTNREKNDNRILVSDNGDDDDDDSSQNLNNNDDSESDNDSASDSDINNTTSDDDNNDDNDDDKDLNDNIDEKLNIKNINLDEQTILNINNMINDNDAASDDDNSDDNSDNDSHSEKSDNNDSKTDSSISLDILETTNTDLDNLEVIKEELNNKTITIDASVAGDVLDENENLLDINESSDVIKVDYNKLSVKALMEIAEEKNLLQNKKKLKKSQLLSLLNN